MHQTSLPLEQETNVGLVKLRPLALSKDLDVRLPSLHLLRILLGDVALKRPDAAIFPVLHGHKGRAPLLLRLDILGQLDRAVDRVRDVRVELDPAHHDARDRLLLLAVTEDEATQGAQLINVDGCEVLGRDNSTLADERFGLGVDVNKVLDGGVRFEAVEGVVVGGRAGEEVVAAGFGFIGPAVVNQSCEDLAELQSQSAWSSEEPRRRAYAVVLLLGGGLDGREGDQGRESLGRHVCAGTE